MAEKITIVTIEKTIADEINNILSKGQYVRDAQCISNHEDVLFVVCGEWPSGEFADIKLVNADPPYIDPVLFDSNGHELAAAEPDAENIEGKYCWDVGDDTYVLKIESA